MFANGVTFMPVLVGGQTFTLEAHGMHELEPAPEMHNIPSPFDDWTCEEFDRFERETWPLLVAPQDLGNLVNLADDSDDAVTPLIVPATPTEASWSVPSPKPPTELENDDVIAETETMSASSTNLRHRTAPSSDLTNRVGVSVSSADAGPQGSAAKKTRRKQRLSPLKADGSERPLPKDAAGYATPLAVYTRLAQQPKVRTTDLEGLVAPASNAHILQVIKGKETIQCRFTRNIKEGVWVASQGGSCSVKIQGFESYRRHVIQCHLDVARIPDKKQEEVIGMRLREVIAMKGSATAASMIASSSSAATSQLANRGNTSKSSRNKRKWDSDSDIGEDWEDEEDDGKDADFVPGGNKSKRRRVN